MLDEYLLGAEQQGPLHCRSDGDFRRFGRFMGGKDGLSSPKRRAAASSTGRMPAQSSATPTAAPSAQPLRSDLASISTAWRWPRTAPSLSAEPGVLGIGPAATARRARKARSTAKASVAEANQARAAGSTLQPAA
jgi:hypothetical protein